MHVGFFSVERHEKPRIRVLTWWRDGTPAFNVSMTIALTAMGGVQHVYSSTFY